MDDPFARRLWLLLEITTQLRASIDQLLVGLMRQIEYLSRRSAGTARSRRR
jgi:hypothetical protein